MKICFESIYVHVFQKQSNMVKQQLNFALDVIAVNNVR